MPGQSVAVIVAPLTVTTAWQLLLATRWSNDLPPAGQGLGLDHEGRVTVLPTGAALIVRDAAGGWTVQASLPADLHALFELYLPFCQVGAAPLCIAHLGQSMDGYIATASGESCYVNGPANLRHLHRLRALCDAVVVGAGTVYHDDPLLTTRRVTGPDPYRIVLDPSRRLSASYQVFNDGAAPTLLVCAGDRLSTGERLGQAEVLAVPGDSDRLDLAVLLTTLRARGLRHVFVEGGGVTVSRFLQAGLLDRLQVAVAPLLLGGGRPGIRLPAVARLPDALRPPHRLYRMGQDVLFDYDLRAGNESLEERDTGVWRIG